MTLRPPRSHSSKPRENVLDREIAQEQASALGRLGRALEAALAALFGHDDALASEPAALTRSVTAVRGRLVQEANDALWCFVIQREACGLRDQRSVVRNYRVPREVQDRMGTFGAVGGRPSA